MDSSARGPLYLLTEILNNIAGWTVVCIAFLLVSDILCRLFRHPIVGTHEIVSYAFGIIIVLAILPASFRDEHISVDLIFMHLPDRTKRRLGILNVAVSLFISGIFFWRSFAETGEAWKVKEKTLVLGISTVLLKGIVCCAFFFLFLFFLIKLLRIFFK